MLVAECLAELRWQPRELGAVVCGAGPGSFTGLRIGLATAKGLCFALGCKLLLVSSLEALAAPVLQTSARPAAVAVLDAFRGQVFARLQLAAAPAPPALQQVLDAHPQLQLDAVWQPEALAAALSPAAATLALCGGGLVRYPQLQLPGALVTAGVLAPDPLAVARLGLVRLARGEQSPLLSAVPNYVCAAAVEAAAAQPPVDPAGPDGGTIPTEAR